MLCYGCVVSSLFPAMVPVRRENSMRRMGSNKTGPREEQEGVKREERRFVHEGSLSEDR